MLVRRDQPSHAARRKRAKPDKFREKNRKRLKEVGAKRSRHILARIRLQDLFDSNPKVQDDKGAVWNEIHSSKILKPFTQIPRKENGVDIEGLAIDGDELLLCFRGSVLRWDCGCHADRSSKKRSNLLYLDLGGWGIRDLCRIDRVDSLSLPVQSVTSQHLTSFMSGPETTNWREMILLIREP